MSRTWTKKAVTIVPADKIHKWTDEELIRLERRINSEYTKAYQEIRKEMADIMQKISTNPNMSLQQKMAEMNKYNRLQNLSKQMAEVLQDTNKTAQSFISKSMQNIYKTNYNFSAEQLGFSLLDNTAVRNILTGDVNPFTKLSIAGEQDKRAIMRRLESELTTGILKGESIPNIAKRLKSVSEGYLGDTIRIARTETTRVEGSARQAVGDEGKRLGFEMEKVWVATHDDRTRDDHLAMDGVAVPNDEPFVLPDGTQMMFPGDISLGAGANQVCNCRCSMINRIVEKG